MNKKLLLIGGGVLAIVIIIGGVLLFINNNSKVEEEGAGGGILEENLVELSSEDVGLTLSSQKNNQQLVMVLTKLDEVESFEYEVSYDAVEQGEVVSQGTFGSGPNPDEEGKATIKRVIDLGTCSAVCRYHKGVETIEFVLRVNLKSGEVGIIEETYNLE